MKMKRLFQAVLVLTALLGVSLISPAPRTFAAADTCTWTGLVNTNWSNGGNWTGCDNGDVPQNGDDLVFPVAAANRTNVNDIGAMSLNTVTFADTYTLSGGALTIAGGALTSTNGTSIINNAVALSQNATFTASGGGSIFLTTTSSLDLSTRTLTIAAGGNGVMIASVISGSGNIIKNGTDVLSLSGTNTYTGTTAINAGSVTLTSSNGFGSPAGATTVASGATVNINITGLTIPEPITIAGTGNVGGGALRNFTGTNTWSGDITVGGTVTELNSDSGHFLTVTGHLIGSPTLLEIGGQVVFTNSNSFGGPVTVFSGSDVRFNGSGAGINVENDGTLGGIGSIGNLTVSGTNQINPGDDTADVFATNNLALNATTTVNMDLRSGTSDQLNVSGTVNLANALLATNIDFTPAIGTQFVLINNDDTDAVIGTFADLAEGATFTLNGVMLQISYVGGTGNDVVLTAVAPTVVTAPTTPTPGVPDTGLRSQNMITVATIGIIGLTLTTFAAFRTYRLSKERA